MTQWESVIGIECHVELKTNSKMFCACPNEFGGEPNTKVCPVCLALPGALPVANKIAIEHMIRAGLAFGAEIPEFSKFDRKNYFYPDMPKDYQISQYAMPLTQGGAVRYWLADGSMKECRLTRIHLEEDTGKSLHAGTTGRIAGSSHSLIDFNRAGVPLMECVSEPELHSADEAIGYLEALKRTFVQLGISDVKMEEGSLRCDANVSIRPAASTELGTKAEIKNMNSFRSVHRAIESEIARQIEIVQSGGRVVQETRGWDEGAGRTHTMRSKEQTHDYRYFPDPDLVPVEVDRELVESIRTALPELPHERFARYRGHLKLTPAQATQLIEDAALGDYFDACVSASGHAQQSANFVLGDLARLANENRMALYDSPVRPEHVGELVRMVESKTINSKIAKDLIARMWAGDGSPAAIVEREGLAQSSDVGTIDPFIDEVLRANEKSVMDFRAGKTNVLGFLVGQVMKASAGKANPRIVQERMREKLG
ncbi:MAG: Asp-tRNA(Asn)/Glu-tRNA(Gln) amidotransferase GatCAB subunit B [Candidatus Meridianibacter frigidus]|nr:MAG: Asp-tRNA(Asn)/Glu-tRNA(Gln) amidotransferase GatCAB subunit B [Candidatus Eremiobacteraeota bacterium]